VRREDKFGYGFLCVAIGVPYLIERFFNLSWAIVFSVACVVTGSVFLFAGHRHKETEVGGTTPRRKVCIGLMYFGAIGTLTILCSIGLVKIIPRTKTPVATNEPPPVLPITTETPNVKPKNDTRPKSHQKARPSSLQSLEDPQVRHNIARRIAELSQGIAELAQEIQPGENALEPIDPAIPRGKTNTPYMMREKYLQATASKFHFNHRFDSRCVQLMSALSSRADLAEDAKSIANTCQGLPREATELRRLSDSLAALAERVERPPQ